MRLLVLGASGATGTIFVRQAVDAGHQVVAFTRDPDRAVDTPGVSWRVGDARDEAALEAAADVDAVVSTVGLGLQRDPGGLFRDSHRALVAAAARTGLRRVVVMSSFGVGDSLRTASLPVRLLYRPGAAVFADKAEGERLLRAADLDWTLVYPVLLTDGRRRGSTSAVDLENLRRLPGVPRISRADVADFLLETVERGAWVRRTVVIRTR